MVSSAHHTRSKRYWANSHRLGQLHAVVATGPSGSGCLDSVDDDTGLRRDFDGADPSHDHSDTSIYSCATMLLHGACDESDGLATMVRPRCPRSCRSCSECADDDAGMQAATGQSITCARIQASHQCDVAMQHGLGHFCALSCGICSGSGSGGGNNDSCRYANDGECDEPNYCSSGTDCSDCRSCSGH